MNENTVYLGASPLKQNGTAITGGYVEIGGEKFYKIANYNKMQPFFMSIVSDSNHWLFISSKGGLTAGRKNPDNAVFPYYTDDKIHDSNELTGNKTILFVEKNDRKYLWEPFSDNYAGIYNIERNIYKNVIGNKLIFEEINNDLNVSYQYSWNNSDEFGFVKTSKIFNHTGSALKINLLDGIQNILPAGVERIFQVAFSTLADAYKKNELLPENRIGIYSLSSIPVDKAEPSESLKATVVWSLGLPNAKVLLSSQQINQFKTTQIVEQEIDIRALRGAYLLNSEITISAGGNEEWRIIIDSGKDITYLASLENKIENEKNLNQTVTESIEKGSDNLIRIVANADGLQVTGDELSSSRHFSNVLFNVMRGGIFYKNYQVEKKDFILYINTINKKVAEAETGFINSLAEKFNYSDLLQFAAKTNNNSLLRICYEYLPLTFSRRHGDPSRPWNLFSIETKNEDGSQILSYQGNWRDIFQNWEALGLSFPTFIESMISKFVNASTFDGYNPYRITRNGIDWEVIDPHDPWSNIGYWGDHQIIYLLKLLELSQKYNAGKIDIFLNQDLFSYANVPYQINDYEALLKNPQETINFDHKLQKTTEERTAKIGADGKLVFDKQDNVYMVNLTEKLLVTILSKFTNFVPEAGIWMNTQRPEWNDANNALVGNGVSMVTLYYMRRYANFIHKLFVNSKLQTIQLSEEVGILLGEILNVFNQNIDLLANKISDRDRKKILDQLGKAGSDYRKKFYANGFNGNKQTVDKQMLISFCELALQYIDHSIKANKRADNLYNAYNLIKIENENEISVKYLYQMLEGQVALLSSSYLNVGEALELLDNLRNSALYRKDQNSFLLYPDRQLPRFNEKNVIPENDFSKSQLLKQLIVDGNNTVVVKDVKGNHHFNGTFRNAAVLRSAIAKLDKNKYGKLVASETQLILDIYENIFNHSAFTGRSGTFFKYEGLGCIYWHMVSKLLLATSEIFYDAVNSGASSTITERLSEHYYKIKDGLGIYKSPELYGSFPTDPYSHTPAYAGVQQPGMTGQVKEDVISRFSELGMFVKDGEIGFNCKLLKKSEFLNQSQSFNYFDINNEPKQILLTNNQLAYTYCQIPVVYQSADENKVVVKTSFGSQVIYYELKIEKQLSNQIFNRTGKVIEIDVFVK